MNSASHGAGRKMSRKETIRNITLGAFAGAVILAGGSFVLSEVSADVDVVEKTTRIERLAEKLRETVEKTQFNIESHAIKLTISIGVADYQANSSLESIFIAADKQLYKAKRLGRNKVYASSKEQLKQIEVPA